MESLNNKLRDSNGRFLQMVEECKMKANMITELKRENGEFERKIKQTQELYEQVRQDKNVFSTKLNNAIDQNVAFNMQFQIVKHKIESLNTD